MAIVSLMGSGLRTLALRFVRRFIVFCGLGPSVFLWPEAVLDDFVGILAAVVLATLDSSAPVQYTTVRQVEGPRLLYSRGCWA
jgi:hypothetical protein